MLLAVSSAPAVMEYFQQNLTPAVVLFLAAAAASVARSWLVTAGVFLALATMKPDIMVIVIPWFLFWAAARWRERGRLIWSFAIGMTVLVASAEVLSPGWPTRFVMALRQYPAYGADPSIVEVLLPWPLAKLCSLVLLISLAAVCWRWRKAEAGSEPYGWTLVCVCTVTLAIIPKLAAYNGILLLPALIWLVAHYRTILSLPLFPRAMTKATFACVFWAWPSAVALSLMNTFLPRKWTYAGSLVPAYTWLALTPLTMIAVIAVALAVRGGEEDQRQTAAEVPSR
jgi:hypothetical protein